MPASESSIIKIMIADDHGLFAEGLEQILNNTPGFEIIARVDNGKLLMQTLNRLTPDLILLDIHMPLMDGLETATAIKKRLPDIKIIFISMTYDTSYKTFLHKYDIDGFVSKTVNFSLLKEAIQNVIAGHKIVVPPLHSTEPDEAQLSSESEHMRAFKLTRTEIEIIQLITHGDSTKMIAAKRNLSYLTVETHRKNIFRKLHVKNMAEVAAFAAKHNLIK